eukprot:1442054-Rhodomonas_salina.1
MHIVRRAAIECLVIRIRSASLFECYAILQPPAVRGAVLTQAVLLPGGDGGAGSGDRSRVQLLFYRSTTLATMCPVLTYTMRPRPDKMSGPDTGGAETRKKTIEQLKADLATVRHTDTARTAARLSALASDMCTDLGCVMLAACARGSGGGGAAAEGDRGRASQDQASPPPPPSITRQSDELGPDVGWIDGRQEAEGGGGKGSEWRCGDRERAGGGQRARGGAGDERETEG